MAYLQLIGLRYQTAGASLPANAQDSNVNHGQKSRSGRLACFAFLLALVLLLVAEWNSQRLFGKSLYSPAMLRHE